MLEAIRAAILGRLETCGQAASCFLRSAQFCARFSATNARPKPIVRTITATSVHTIRLRGTVGSSLRREPTDRGRDVSNAS